MASLRIAQVAPPLERVPPRAYGGTERIVYELLIELQRRGHEVTLFASGDSDVPCELVPTVPEALRPAGFAGETAPYFYQTLLDVLGRAHEFDVIHSHLEWASVLLMAVSPTPVVSTFHGRLDFPFSRRYLAGARPGMVAISDSQASAHPEVPWTIVHNGLSLERSPFERRRGEDLCFVGRVNPEKGIMEAMEVARLSGRRLRIAAKVGTIPADVEFYEHVFKPAVDERPDVEYLGEVTGEERDELYATSYATLMPGSWPEPFGLVAIESLACGTPVVARRVGALPEIIRPDVDGFFADDTQQMAFLLDGVASLDRKAIRRSVLERFSARRMTDRYLEVYEEAMARAAGGSRVADERVTPLAAARSAHRRAAGNVVFGAPEEAGVPASAPADADADRPDRGATARGASAQGPASGNSAGSASSGPGAGRLSGQGLPGGGLLPSGPDRRVADPRQTLGSPPTAVPGALPSTASGNGGFHRNGGGSGAS